MTIADLVLFATPLAYIIGRIHQGRIHRSRYLRQVQTINLNRRRDRP